MISAEKKALIDVDKHLRDIACSNENCLETANDLFNLSSFPSNINPAYLPITLMRVESKLAWQPKQTQLTGLILTLRLPNIGSTICLGWGTFMKNDIKSRNLIFNPSSSCTGSEGGSVLSRAQWKKCSYAYQNGDKTLKWL